MRSQEVKLRKLLAKQVQVSDLLSLQAHPRPALAWRKLSRMTVCKQSGHFIGAPICPGRLGGEFWSGGVRHEVLGCIDTIMLGAASKA